MPASPPWLLHVPGQAAGFSSRYDMRHPMHVISAAEPLLGVAATGVERCSAVNGHCSCSMQALLGRSAHAACNLGCCGGYELHLLSAGNDAGEHSIMRCS